jgi:hypothetical protein
LGDDAGLGRGKADEEQGVQNREFHSFPVVQG